MATTPIPQSQSRLELILVEAEDKVPLNGLLWEPQKAGDSLVVMVPGGTTGAVFFPAHDYSPLAAGHHDDQRIAGLLRLPQQPV